MIKKQKPLVFEIEQKVADALGIKKKSDLEMVVVNDMLILKAKRKPSAKNKNIVTQKLMTDYEAVLKKLAKT